jgi:hypothetical protein
LPPLPVTIKEYPALTVFKPSRVFGLGSVMQRGGLNEFRPLRKEVTPMRRIMLLVVVALIMAAMMVSAMPSFAASGPYVTSERVSAQVVIQTITLHKSLM